MRRQDQCAWASRLGRAVVDEDEDEPTVARPALVCGEAYAWLQAQAWMRETAARDMEDRMERLAARRVAIGQPAERWMAESVDSAEWFECKVEGS